MISVIVCSINEKNFSAFEISLKNTIGIDYEIIKIENSITDYSLSKAYNIGAKKAIFPFVCFVHEDILFKDENWGIELTNFYKNNIFAGVVGVAGSTVKTLTPSIWANGLFNTDYYNLIQYYKKTDTSVHLQFTNVNDDYVEVKTLDGVFLFTKKEIWEANKFDETLAKFHCYDLDFCIQVGQSKKNYVAYTILLEHHSTGNLNKDWTEASVRLSEKWQHLLPLGNLDKSKMKALEWKNKKVLFYRMNILKYPLKAIVTQFIKWNYFKNFSLTNHLSFAKELLMLMVKSK